MPFFEHLLPTETSEGSRRTFAGNPFLLCPVCASMIEAGGKSIERSHKLNVSDPGVSCSGTVAGENFLLVLRRALFGDLRNRILTNFPVSCTACCGGPEDGAPTESLRRMPKNKP